MSMLSRPPASTDLGESVASARDYEAAQKKVSQLIAGEVPARDIAIVGQGVRTVERVTGKLGYATAARSGAMNGILIGLLLSAILVLGNPDAQIALFVGFVLVGIAIGMLLSLVSYMIIRKRRDFVSVTQMLADHYEITVQRASLAKARQVLGGERPVAPRAPVNLDEPPRYGERVPQQPAPATPTSPAMPTQADIPPKPPTPGQAESTEQPPAPSSH